MCYVMWWFFLDWNCTQKTRLNTPFGSTNFAHRLALLPTSNEVEGEEVVVVKPPGASQEEKKHLVNRSVQIESIVDATDNKDNPKPKAFNTANTKKREHQTRQRKHSATVAALSSTSVSTIMPNPSRETSIWRSDKFLMKGQHSYLPVDSSADSQHQKNIVNNKKSGDKDVGSSKRSNRKLTTRAPVKSSGYGGKYAKLNQHDKDQVVQRRRSRQQQENKEEVASLSSIATRPSSRIPTSVGKLPPLEGIMCMTKEQIDEKVREWLQKMSPLPIQGICRIPVLKSRLKHRNAEQRRPNVPKLPSLSSLVENKAEADITDVKSLDESSIDAADLFQKMQSSPEQLHCFDTNIVVSQASAGTPAIRFEDVLSTASSTSSKSPIDDDLNLNNNNNNNNNISTSAAKSVITTQQGCEIESSMKVVPSSVAPQRKSAENIKASSLKESIAPQSDTTTTDHVPMLSETHPPIDQQLQLATTKHQEDEVETTPRSVIDVVSTQTQPIHQIDPQLQIAITRHRDNGCPREGTRLCAIDLLACQQQPQPPSLPSSSAAEVKSFRHLTKKDAARYKKRDEASSTAASLLAIQNLGNFLPQPPQAPQTTTTSPPTFPPPLSYDDHYGNYDKLPTLVSSQKQMLREKMPPLLLNNNNNNNNNGTRSQQHVKFGNVLREHAPTIRRIKTPHPPSPIQHCKPTPHKLNLNLPKVQRQEQQPKNSVEFSRRLTNGQLLLPSRFDPRLRARSKTTTLPKVFGINNNNNNNSQEQQSRAASSLLASNYHHQHQQFSLDMSRASASSPDDIIISRPSSPPVAAALANGVSDSAPMLDTTQELRPDFGLQSLDLLTVRNEVEEDVANFPAVVNTYQRRRAGEDRLMTAPSQQQPQMDNNSPQPQPPKQPRNLLGLLPARLRIARKNKYLLAEKNDNEAPPATTKPKQSATKRRFLGRGKKQNE